MQETKRDVLSKNSSAMVLGPSVISFFFVRVHCVLPLMISARRFKVQDDEIGKDDLAAWACIRLDRLRRGYRLVHLYDTAGNLSDGFLLVNIEKSFT